MHDPYRYGPHHKQKTVRVGDWSADIDIPIAPLIEEIWRARWQTIASCQEHDDTGLVWIEFAHPLSVYQFLEAVMLPLDPERPESLFRRVANWGFGAGKSKPESAAPDSWRYHVSVRDRYDQDNQVFTPEIEGFWLSIHVLFPQGDTEYVTQRMKAYNHRRAAR